MGREETGELPQGKGFLKVQGQDFTHKEREMVTLWVAFLEESGILELRRGVALENVMKGILVGTGVVGAYVALQMWILPAMGVQT